MLHEATGQATRARPRGRKGAGPLGLEIRLMWGDQMVGSHFFHPGNETKFTVGTAAGVNFSMGDSRLAGPSFEVIRGTAPPRFTCK